MTPQSAHNSLTLVQIGMRAAIRDMQDWLDAAESYQGESRLVSSEDLQAYLIAMLFTAGVPMGDDWALMAGERGES